MVQARGLPRGNTFAAAVRQQSAQSPRRAGRAPVPQGAAWLQAAVRDAVVLLLQQAARGGDAGAVHRGVVGAGALQREQAAGERLGVHCV